MEPAGLALAVFTSLKEVFLLGRFIYRTVQSQKHYDAERVRLHKDLEYEVLFLRSLGMMLSRTTGLLGGQALESEWIANICDILERLRKTCGDYSKIAANSDPEYQTHSPYLRPDIQGDRIIEFNDLQPLISSKPSKYENISSAFKWPWTRSASLDHLVVSWQWAIFERRKIEAIVAKFQKQNGKIKDLLPLMSVAMQLQSSAREETALQALINHDSTDRLGLASHARLQQLITDPSTDTRNFDLGNMQLEAQKGTFNPVLGTIAKVQWRGSSREPVLVEYKESDQTGQTSVPADGKRRVHQLACLLSSSAKSDLHTLRCRGYVYEQAQNRFAFVFDFPSSVIKEAPDTLNGLITSDRSSSRLSLPQRFRIAEVLAKTIGAFHADGWVHKSIQSHSILFFRNSETEQLSISKPYLANFEYSRPETAETNLTFDGDPEKNLYRHPDRQGPPKTSFSKLHDIYALGIVLLEIGVWTSALKMFNDACKELKTGSRPNSRGVRNIFKHIAEKKLAHAMGPAYEAAVLACISDEFKDLTSSAAFPRIFYEKVIKGVDGAMLFKTGN